MASRDSDDHATRLVRDADEPVHTVATNRVIGA